MMLAFKASYVTCSSALDGEILEVSFDTIPESKDENERDTPYALISRNFEFPGATMVEWDDGCDHYGAAELVSVRLTRDRVLMHLDQGLEIHVSFAIGERRFRKLSSFLIRMLP